MIDLATNKHTFFDETKTYLEYTPNSIAYDYGGEEHLIIDLTGKSVEDVCARHIRIPVAEGDREAWATQNRNGKKIFRYWKLRAKGFTPIEGAAEYVKAQADCFIKVNGWIAMKRYYCMANFNTVDLLDYGKKCMASEKICTDPKIKEKDQAFRKAISTDLNGWTPPVCGKIYGYIIWVCHYLVSHVLYHIFVFLFL